MNLNIQKTKKNKKEGGNDLWAEDGGIGNAGVIDDEDTLQAEKSSEVDSVVISAQMYGKDDLSFFKDENIVVYYSSFSLLQP